MRLGAAGDDVTMVPMNYVAQPYIYSIHTSIKDW